MFCDITMPDGSPSWADPRHVLRRALSRAAEAGFTCYVHPEIEFYLLRDLPGDGTPPVPADTGGYFDQASHDAAPHFRRRAIESLEAMGISVEFSHHEGGPGQQEIDLRYADALTMADNIMTFRYIVKEVAITQGVRASFMPKPFTEHAGSAMHTHISLFEGDHNAFHDASEPYELSKTGKAFVAGRAAPRPRALRGDQPVRQLLQAPHRRRRGPDHRVLGPRQPVRRSCASRCTRRARRRRVASRSARSTPRPTRTWRTR